MRRFFCHNTSNLSVTLKNLFTLVLNEGLTFGSHKANEEMMNPMRTVALLFCQLMWFVPNGQAQLPEGETIAHLWNEEVLEGIRNDFARPTVHARNLLHTSIAMFDIWAAYEEGPTETFLLGKTWAGFTCPF